MENIVYEWMSQKPIDFNEHMELPQYTLQHVLLGNCTKTYKESENESCLELHFIILKSLRLLDVMDGIILFLFCSLVIFSVYSQLLWSFIFIIIFVVIFIVVDIIIVIVFIIVFFPFFFVPSASYRSL